jgi:putative restriction endonuclease
MSISFFLKKLSKLRVDLTKGAPAPHKAVLLLSVIQGMEDGEIRENKIIITPELVARFKDNWSMLVHSDQFSPNFSLPFYHLKSGGFWHLHTHPGMEVLLTSSGSIKSFSGLKSAVAYASLDEGVYELLLNRVNRELAIQTLLITYLGGQQLKRSGYDLFRNVENQILNEPASEYQSGIAAADEEEIFVRGGVFKKVVPRVYNYTCCISGMKIVATRDVQMIDACHIVPFSESHDDTIGNGLSLSPNFHRAFDRFLITIDRDFRVVVSPHFSEAGGHSLRAFEGKQIYLPEEIRYRPSGENLGWHYERFLRVGA